MDDGWIERALHRVEMLEAERARCAGSGDPEMALRTIEIDAELEALVEALEAAADDAEEQAQGHVEPGAPMHPAHAWAPAPGYTTIAEPLPQADDTAPMRVLIDPAAAALDDPFDRPRRRLVWPAAAAAIAVLVLGVGAAVASGGVSTEATPPKATAASLAAAAPVTVATAEIPPDTQEPETARGADVDVTPPTVIPESAPAAVPKEPAAKPSRKAKKHRRKKARRSTKKGSGSRGVAFGGSRDPLSGMK